MGNSPRKLGNQLLKAFLVFYDFLRLIQCLREIATEPYPEQN
jgi:hypothetical protein